MGKEGGGVTSGLVGGGDGTAPGVQRHMAQCTVTGNEDKRQERGRAFSQMEIGLLLLQDAAQHEGRVEDGTTEGFAPLSRRSRQTADAAGVSGGGRVDGAAAEEASEIDSRNSRQIRQALGLKPGRRSEITGSVMQVLQLHVVLLRPTTSQALSLAADLQDTWRQGHAVAALHEAWQGHRGYTDQRLTADHALVFAFR